MNNNELKKLVLSKIKETISIKKVFEGDGNKFHHEHFEVTMRLPFNPGITGFEKEFIHMTFDIETPILRQCNYCGRMKRDVKKVQFLKWKDELTKGMRYVCKDCRRYLGNEVRVVKELCK